MSHTYSQPSWFARCVSFALAFGLLLTATTTPAIAQPGDFTHLVFDTELTSMTLSGGPVGMPLASDPGNALGDSIDGFGFVNSLVQVTLSSQRPVSPGPRSLGQACAFEGSPAATARRWQCGSETPPVDPAEHDGEPFFVSSFFDVFFDVTVTDVDARPGRDYASGTPVIQLTDIGPANMQTIHNAIFDADAPNFGLIPPPEASPYIGHFGIVIDLSTVFGMTVDINQNGDPDVLKFTLATHAAGDENRTFITLPDGTVIDSFDSTANLRGAIQDASTDPPFIMDLSGPVVASSQLQNPVVPEPAALVLLALGGLLRQLSAVAAGSEGNCRVAKAFCQAGNRGRCCALAGSGRLSQPATLLG